LQQFRICWRTGSTLEIHELKKGVFATVAANEELVRNLFKFASRNISCGWKKVANFGVLKLQRYTNKITTTNQTGGNAKVLSGLK